MEHLPAKPKFENLVLVGRLILYAKILNFALYLLLLIPILCNRLTFFKKTIDKAFFMC